MAVHSLNHLAQLINQQFESQEIIGENLIKAKALLAVALEGELLNYPSNITYQYLLAVSDFVEKASVLSEASLSSLIKYQRSFITITETER